MVGQNRGFKYWLGALSCALIGASAAFYAGVWAYNNEIERTRAAVGETGIVDGRVPFEVPLYAALGAVAGWWLFRAATKYLPHSRRKSGSDSIAS
jgi:hypothetical protein